MKSLSRLNAETFPAAGCGVSRVGSGRRWPSPSGAGLGQRHIESPGSSAGERAAFNHPSVAAIRAGRGAWRRVPVLAAAVLAFAGAGPRTPAAEQASQLWGVSGEHWSPQSRLPDFSFAGYRRGEETFRIPQESISVAAFGAKGDGRTDDTAAFKQAIAAGAGKVILVPPGRFVLSDTLEIRSSNLVLRGAGSGKTVLLFTRSLEDLRPRSTRLNGEKTTSQWSWGGGLIMIGTPRTRWHAAERPTGEVKIVSPAQRGDNRLTLETSPFKAGDEVVLTVFDDRGKSLLAYLYRGKVANVSGLSNWECRQVFRVTAVAGNTITLDRGLRFEVRSAWRPVVGPFRPELTDVGVEGLAFEFPPTPYGGHFTEAGYNPVAIASSAAHCWLRDLRIWNADSGPYVAGTFCTADGIHLGADPARQSTIPGRHLGYTGHHGISFFGSDGLCTNFTIETQFIHDLTVQSASGSVFSSGQATNLAIDHHRWAPYENLFTDIDGGEGTRLFRSSGDPIRGDHSGAGATFWNIRTRQPVDWPKDIAAMTNAVGLNTAGAPEFDPEGQWFEAIPAGELRPANLHKAMLERRLGKGAAKPR